VLCVELGPILFENAVVGFEVAPHFGSGVRCDDGDLRDVELKGREGTEIGIDGLRSFRGQADDVVAVGIESDSIEAFGEFEGGLDFFVLVHLLENFLVETLNAKEGAFHAAARPLIKIAKEEIDAGLHEPADTMASKEFGDRIGVGGQVAEIFVKHQDEANAVLRVPMEHAIHGFERDGFGLRGEGGGLAEGATEAATARREENADGNAPAAGELEFGDQRRVLNFVEAKAEMVGNGFLAIADKGAIESGLDGGSKCAVVTSPDGGNTGGASFVNHIKDFVGFLQVEREAHSVPAAAELRGEFGARGVFEDGNSGNVLPEETKAEGDAARHTEAPAKFAGSIFAVVVVQTGFAAAGRKEDS